MYCKSLPSARLPIRKDSTIVPVDTRDRNLFPNDLENLFLGN
jgi:hypothetical protein